MIHPSAIISDEATIADGVEIGPFTIIEGKVDIAAGCKIGGHAWLKGPLSIAENNQIGFGAIIGADPQDRSFDPSVDGGTKIGTDNIFREYVTIHRNTQPGKFTTIGNHNFLMTGAHLAHDVVMGDHNNLANNVLVAGHVSIGNSAFIGGGAVFHQFIRIGDFAIAQGNSGFSKDLPPFCLGHHVNRISGLNVIGMRRAGLSPSERQQVKAAYKMIFRSSATLPQALAAADERDDWSEPAKRFFDFFRTPSKKGVLTREGD